MYCKRLRDADGGFATVFVPLQDDDDNYNLSYSINVGDYSYTEQTAGSFDAEFTVDDPANVEGVTGFSLDIGDLLSFNDLTVGATNGMPMTGSWSATDGISGNVVSGDNHCFCSTSSGCRMVVCIWVAKRLLDYKGKKLNQLTRLWLQLESSHVRCLFIEKEGIPAWLCFGSDIQTSMVFGNLEYKLEKNDKGYVIEYDTWPFLANGSLVMGHSSRAGHFAQVSTIRTENKSVQSNLTDHIFLYVIVSITGAAVMMIELMGTRIIGPFYGVSLFVWSSLISVTLLALAIGYYVGGLLADKQGFVRLSHVIFLAAILTGVIPLMSSGVLSATNSLGLRAGAFASAFILFSPCLVLLGMAGPFVIKMATSRLEGVGVVVGSVYAVSTLGSVFGTLLLGFYLLPLAGIRLILLSISLVLLLLGFFVSNL